MAQRYYLPFSNNKKISLYNLAYIDPFTWLRKLLLLLQRRKQIHTK